jgi:AmmeMemoRadiSam system protein B
MAAHRDDDASDLPSARLLASPPPPKPAASDIRAARFAGRDYPKDSIQLRSAIARLLPSTTSQGERTALGLVLPHGPLAYTGAIAAAALQRAIPDETAIILAPNHAARGARAAITSHHAYAIPGAVIAVEDRLVESIRALGGLSEAPAAFADEHAIEVLLPLLVAARPRLSIVPILLHDLNPHSTARVGAAIADAVVGRGGGATIVATTDFVHYADRATLEEVVPRLLAHVVALDEDGLVAEVEALARRPGPTLEMCGLGPLLTAIHALRLLGAAPGEITAQGSSESVEGAARGHVGYGSAVFFPRVSRVV